MGLFNLIKKGETFESEIAKLKKFTIKDQQNSKVVEISKTTTFENIMKLLCIL